MQHLRAGVAIASVDHTAELWGLQEWLRPWVTFTLDSFQQIYGERPVVTSTWRSRNYQASLKGKYAVVADPGESSHEYGFGWDSDVHPRLRSAWIDHRRRIGWNLAKNVAKDPYHSDYPGWQALVGLRAS